MGAGASDYFTSYADVSHGYLDAELAMEDLHDLAAHGRFHHVRIRLKQGLDPNGIRRDYDSDSDSDGGDEYARGDTPLICAARGHQWNKGRERHIRTMAALVEFGAAVNKYNRLEQTALFVACDRDLLVIAEWLMQHGADTNKACKTGETPLMCAYRNENAALVELLLRHGARVERPPPQLSCVKFPTLTNQVTAKKASSDEQAKMNDDAAKELDPPAHPHWIVQAIRRPMTTPETRRKLRKSNQLPEDSTLQTIHGTIEKAVEKEQEQRQQLIKEVEDTQRIEDQRVYHAQLASESRKRRDRRRAQREDASRLRLQHAAELKMERLAPRSTHSQHTGGTASALHGHKVELLSWERSIDLSASSTRPRWVAQPVWSEQQREGRSKQRELVQECQTMVEAMQHAKTRRERLLVAPTLSSIGSRPETAPV